MIALRSRKHFKPTLENINTFDLMNCDPAVFMKQVIITAVIRHARNARDGTFKAKGMRVCRPKAVFQITLPISVLDLVLLKFVAGHGEMGMPWVARVALLEDLPAE